jgi:uncharacterized protein YjiS (DUF1127 family)
VEQEMPEAWTQEAVMLIMTFATKPIATVSVVATRIVTRGITGVISFSKAILNRREIMRLTELDERGLKDIGLVRSDVEGALATSWLRDPSTCLAARSNAASHVASVRREEGGRQAQAKTEPVRARSSAPVNEHVVACSA